MIRIVLADTDVEYLNRLELVLANYKDLSISIFSDKDALEKALRSKRIDILLFSNTIYDGQVSLAKDTLAIMLYDMEEAIPETCIGFKKVNKYQRISTIYQQVLYEYSEYARSRGVVIGGTKTKTIAFYSPIGGSGKTTIALATALKLSMEGKKTFFLSFEDIASDECVLPVTNERGISEIAAELASDIDFRIKIQGLLQQKNDNLFYLKHFDSPNDIYELSGEERERIIDIIENTKLFDFIVLDMGTSLSKDALKPFDIAEAIVIVENNSSISLKKMATFLSQTHIIHQYKSKMRRVENFYRGSYNGVECDIPIIGTINASQSPESGSFIEWLAGQPVMNFVMQLIQ